jgi:hypothetical protein
LRRAKYPGQDRADARSEQQARGRAHGGVAAGEAAPARIAALDQENRGCGEFSSDRQALQHAEADQEQRRRGADGRIAGQQAHRESGHGHQSRGGKESLLAAETVADMAEQRTANGPHQKGGRKHAEGGGQRKRRVIGWKEVLRQRGREIPVGGEIVPFQDVADGAGQDLPHALARDRGLRIWRERVRRRVGRHE